MARYNKLGNMPCQIFCEDFALPNATSKDSTNVCQIPARQSGDLRVVVCASDTTVELVSGATLEIRPVVGTTTSPATVLPSVLITEAVQTTASWASGLVIADFSIPKFLIGTNTYIKLTFVTSGDERADNIEAYLITD